MLRRAVVTWILMVPMAILNGVVREKVVRKSLDELPAHQVSVVTGSAAFFGLAYAMWHTHAKAIDDLTLARIGGSWLLGTMLFEFGFGAKRGLSMDEMLHDYDVRAGRLWPVVLIVIAASPLAVKRLATRRHHPAAALDA